MRYISEHGKKNVKSLYYCRSTSVQRADKVSHKSKINELDVSNDQEQDQYEECLSCQ